MSGRAPNAEVEVFLFPLPQVTVFPATTKPLNIFEPRYVRMVEDALKDERMIAIAYAEPVGAELREAGALSHVRSVAGYGTLRLFERRPNGTMIVLLDVVGKLELESVVASTKPYVIARGRVIDEPTTIDSAHVFLLNRLVKRFRARIEEHMHEPREREAFWAKLVTPEQKLNAYCAMMVEDPEQRQRLLEAKGLNERLSLATLFLDAESTSH